MLSCNNTLISISFFKKHLKGQDEANGDNIQNKIK
jgi:hypothetical protein